MKVLANIFLLLNFMLLKDTKILLPAKKQYHILKSHSQLSTYLKRNLKESKSIKQIYFEEKQISCLHIIKEDSEVKNCLTSLKIATKEEAEGLIEATYEHYQSELQVEISHLKNKINLSTALSNLQLQNHAVNYKRLIKETQMYPKISSIIEILNNLATNEAKLDSIFTDYSNNKYAQLKKEISKGLEEAQNNNQMEVKQKSKLVEINVQEHKKETEKNNKINIENLKKEEHHKATLLNAPHKSSKNNNDNKVFVQHNQIEINHYSSKQDKTEFDKIINEYKDKVNKEKNNKEDKYNAYNNKNKHNYNNTLSYNLTDLNTTTNKSQLKNDNILFYFGIIYFILIVVN